MWILSLIFLILNFNTINCLECNQFDKNSNYVFSTKTNYNRSLSYFNSSNLNDLDLTKFVPDTCKLDQLYLLSRHSTRNPSYRSTKSFMNLYPKLRKSLFKEFKKDEDRSVCEYYLFYHLNKWTFRYALKDAGLIVKIGDEITNEIGGRFGRVFGELLYNNNVQLGVTRENRTFQTMKSFLQGLEKPLLNSSVKQRSSLYFHDLENEKEVEDDAEDELIRKYKKSSTVKKLKKEVGRRLGLKKKLKLKELKYLYNLCSFDYQLYQDPFWCNFIAKDEFDVIEFLMDATTFRKLQSSLESDRKKSAIFFRELRDFLISSKEKVFLGFSHSEVLKVILINLKLFDSFYLSENFDDAFEKSSTREFRTSKILPFNSNLAFVKYNCVNTVSNKTIPKLLTLFQEQPIKVANCNDFLCPLDTFLRYIYPLHCSLG